MPAASTPPKQVRCRILARDAQTHIHRAPRGGVCTLAVTERVGAVRRRAGRPGNRLRLRPKGRPRPRQEMCKSAFVYS